MATTKKAQMGKRVKPTMSAKDSMMMYGRQSDSLANQALKKGPSKGAKDLKAAGEARKKETKIAKRLYGTGPSSKYKTGGSMMKKAQNGATKQSGEKDLSRAKKIRENMSKDLFKKMQTKEGKASVYSQRNTADSLMKEARRKRAIMKTGGKTSKKK